MRIAFVATGFSDYSVEAAAALARHCDLLLVGERNRLEQDSNVDIREELARSGRLKTMNLRHPHRYVSCLRTWHWIARFRPDAIIVHQQPDEHTVWIYRQIAKLAKFYLIVHDPVPHSGRDHDRAVRNARRIKKQRKMADAYLVHGDYCAKTVTALGIHGGKPVISVPHGPILRPKQVCPPTHPNRVLMFGRMEAYKGLDTLLATIRLLVEQGVDVEIRLAGDGPELARLLGDFTALPCCSVRSEFLSREDAIQEFQDAAIVVAPYTDATQSGVVAAAFASGRPVIATAVGGLPDYIRHGENGLLVPASAPAELADAIRSVLTDQSLWARMSAGAVKMAANDMGWERFATTIVDHVRRGRSA